MQGAGVLTGRLETRELEDGRVGVRVVDADGVYEKYRYLTVAPGKERGFAQANGVAACALMLDGRVAEVCVCGDEWGFVRDYPWVRLSFWRRVCEEAWKQEQA